MLSPAKVAQIEAEIEKLELALRACSDSGLQAAIESRIKTLKQELANGQRGE
jgi:hypothetical protein